MKRNESLKTFKRYVREGKREEEVRDEGRKGGDKVINEIVADV